MSEPAFPVRGWRDFVPDAEAIRQALSQAGYAVVSKTATTEIVANAKAVAYWNHVCAALQKGSTHTEVNPDDPVFMAEAAQIAWSAMIKAAEEGKP